MWHVSNCFRNLHFISILCTNPSGKGAMSIFDLNNVPSVAPSVLKTPVLRAVKHWLIQWRRMVKLRCPKRNHTETVTKFPRLMMPKVQSKWLHTQSSIIKSLCMASSLIVVEGEKHRIRNMSTVPNSPT